VQILIKTCLRKRKTKFLIAIIAAVTMVCAVSAVVAWKSDTKQDKTAQNDFTPAKIDIALNETVSTGGDENATITQAASTDDDNTLTQNLVWIAETKETTGYYATKEVTVSNSNNTNENNTDAYIRVCIIPKWISTVEVQKVDDNGKVTTETKTVDVQSHYGSLSDFGSLTDINLSNGTSSSSSTDSEETSSKDSLSNDDSLSEDKENDEPKTSSDGVTSFSESASDSSSGSATESSSDTTETNKSTNTYTMGAVTFTLDSKWSDNWIFNPKDGYFYYKTKVAPGGKTEKLLEKVSIEASTKDAMDSAGVSLQVDVIADSIQTNTDANAIYKRWGDAETLGITVGADGTLSLTTD
jgi:hypothetical protein